MPGPLLGAGNRKCSLNSAVFSWVLKRVNISKRQRNEVFDHQRVLFLKLQVFQACVGGEGNQCPKWDSELIKFGEWLSLVNLVIKANYSFCIVPVKIKDHIYYSSELESNIKNILSWWNLS